MRRRRAPGGLIATAEALSGSAGPEGIRWILRGQFHRRHIRRALSGLLEGATLLSCRLHRAKFKPGRKLTAYLDAHLDGPWTPATRPFAVTWTLPASEFDGHLEGNVDSMQGEARRAGLAAPFRELRASSSAAGMQLLISPLDPKYPQLVRASSPAHLRDLLALGHSRGKAGIQVSAVRYRPGQRHVLRYEPAGPDGTDEVLYGKLYPKGDARAAYDLATAISAQLAEMGSPVRGAAPWALVEEDDLLVYRVVRGHPITRRIASLGDAAPFVYRAGQALRLLQGISASHLENVPTHRFDVEVATIARTSEHIRTLLPAVGVRIDDILKRARALHERLPAEERTFAHGDYKCDHLFVDRENMTLIDFNTCSFADPALDVGKFLADLEWWYSRSGRSGLRAAKEAFLDGYGEPTPFERMLRARVYEVLVLTKITAHRVWLFHPAWAEDTRALIGRVDTLLRRLEADAGRSASRRPKQAWSRSGS
jgi:aminoglycoside phosphotransferase (APT) family kinase protein